MIKVQFFIFLCFNAYEAEDDVIRNVKTLLPQMFRKYSKEVMLTAET